MEKDGGAIWLASYPRSGNTWLRCLLEAYRRNGKLDLNDIRISTGDGGATLIRAVSPIPIADLGQEMQLMLRPAMLLNLFCRLSPPLLVKTHFANIQPPGLPPLIPKQLTQKAVYIVRDPRSVVLSLARFYQFSIDKAVETMSCKNFSIGDNVHSASCLVSSWTNHVAGWVSQKDFPVHVVSYEDMMEDPGKELTEVLEFLDEDVDPEMVKVAVEATKMAQLKAAEKNTGFRENSGNGGKFFGDGGTRWQDELGQKWIDQIEEDHGKVMRTLDYLASPEVSTLKTG